MRELNPKQLLVVRYHVAEGNSIAEAARRAGYSATYAARAAQYLGKNAKFKDAVRAAQAEIRDETGLTAQRYLRKLETALAQATEAKQFTAVSSLLQLQGKVAGLLIDRVQVETVDLGGALIEARKRVTLQSIVSSGELPTEPEATDYAVIARSRTAGNTSVRTEDSGHDVFE